MKNRLLLIFFFLLSLVLSIDTTELTDEEWLNTKEDIEPLANAALKELKKTSSIHLYDDLQLIKVFEHKKTIAGYSRSLYLKMSVSSLYFKSEKPEEFLTVLVLQHKQNNKYSFAIPNFPVMKEAYLYQLEEKWSDIHREQREKHFEELRQFTSSYNFENQDYLQQ